MKNTYTAVIKQEGEVDWLDKGPWDTTGEVAPKETLESAMQQQKSHETFWIRRKSCLILFMRKTVEYKLAVTKDWRL